MIVCPKIEYLIEVILCLYISGKYETIWSLCLWIWLQFTLYLKSTNLTCLHWFKKCVSHHYFNGDF